MRTFKDTQYGNLTGQVYDGNIFIYNEDLDSLEGAPKIVSGYFYCSSNNLTSLEGAPREVHGNFDCSINQKLESLEGAPKIVTGNFDCTKCPKLTSLDELLDIEISGKLYSNIMTNEEFRELQALYRKQIKT